MQKRLKFRTVITVSLLTVLTLSTVTTVVRIPVSSVSATTTTPGNQTSIGGSGASGSTGNMTFVGNMTGGKRHEQEIKSMMMEVRSMMVHDIFFYGV